MARRLLSRVAKRSGVALGTLDLGFADDGSRQGRLRVAHDLHLGTNGHRRPFGRETDGESDDLGDRRRMF
jgi:hypothetical protein